MSGMNLAGYQKKQAAVGKSTRLIVNSGWMEQHPLARAEWIKFLALFFNKEKLAAQKFDAIEAKYVEVKKLAAQAKDNPTVFCGLPFKGTWYTPKGESYMAQFLRDAHANYYWNDTKGTGSHPFDFETVFAKANQGKFWLNVSSATNLKDVESKDTRFTKFAAFNQKQVYNNNKRINAGGGNDYWVTGFVNPHLVLSDFVKIFHPELLPNYELTYYQKLK
jgi:iron complex transport system substrate-binding protein